MLKVTAKTKKRFGMLSSSINSKPGTQQETSASQAQQLATWERHKMLLSQLSHLLQIVGADMPASHFGLTVSRYAVCAVMLSDKCT